MSLIGQGTSCHPTDLGLQLWGEEWGPEHESHGLFLSTNGHSALVDMWQFCDSEKQIWAAMKEQQSGHWHFSVMGGNTQDSARVQLSCGLADRAGEAVDLWSEHA